jgi:hypothetical protein
MLQHHHPCFQCTSSCRAGFLQLAPGATWDSTKPRNNSRSSSSGQPWWAGGYGNNQQGQFSDVLFDAEIDELLGITPEQLQQQQQMMPTAADWILGEFTDAAQGLHTFSTLDEEDLGGRNSWSAVAISSGRPAAAGAAPLDLGARDLRQLIKQYSWNADKPELLQVRNVA